MPDPLSPQQRSSHMKRIRSKDTQPELIVRKTVFGLGYRYRLHVRKLPGAPDLVFASKKKVIFVHGCFWHGHQCRKGKRPSSNTAFWNDKLDKNIRRDRKAKKALRLDGWNVMTIWECQLKKPERLKQRFINIRNKFNEEIIISIIYLFSNRFFI